MKVFILILFHNVCVVPGSAGCQSARVVAHIIKDRVNPKKWNILEKCLF